MLPRAISCSTGAAAVGWRVWAVDVEGRIVASEGRDERVSVMLNDDADDVCEEERGRAMIKGGVEADDPWIVLAFCC